MCGKIVMITNIIGFVVDAHDQCGFKENLKSFGTRKIGDLNLPPVSGPRQDQFPWRIDKNAFTYYDEDADEEIVVFYDNNNAYVAAKAQQTPVQCQKTTIDKQQQYILLRLIEYLQMQPTKQRT